MKSSLCLVLSTAASIQAYPKYRHQHFHSHTQSTSTSSPIFKRGYTTTFFDPFVGQAGSLPSSSNWIIDLGTQYPGGAKNWGNNEAEIYTLSPSNIQITKKQNLIITPRKLSNGTWTSARIETKRSDFVAAPGGKLYIESRIKLGDASASLQQGIWPAFWALGNEFRGNYTNWPAASEWDIMEALNGAETMYSTIHCGTAPGGPCNEYGGIGNGGVSFTRGVFHTISFIVDRSMCHQNSTATWKEETMSWYLDGKNVFTVNGTTVGDEEAWDKLAHQDHFLLLNVAVGGNWPGLPTNATVDGPSVQMEVDYVGVWNSFR